MIFARSCLLVVVSLVSNDLYICHKGYEHVFCLFLFFDKAVWFKDQRGSFLLRSFTGWSSFQIFVKTSFVLVLFCQCIFKGSGHYW